MRRPGSIARELFGSQLAPRLTLILAAGLVAFSDGRHDAARQVVKVLVELRIRARNVTTANSQHLPQGSPLRRRTSPILTREHPACPGPPPSSAASGTSSSSHRATRVERSAGHPAIRPTGSSSSAVTAGIPISRSGDTTVGAIRLSFPNRTGSTGAPRAKWVTSVPRDGAQ